jgi:MFS transporter, putative metabolite:H+ symporter
VSAIGIGSIAARLDRLPVTRLHRSVFNLIGVGMFFEGFDIYIAASVLGATYKTGFSTLQQNGLFISTTFVGMTLGALLTGFLGDRYGRRFTYQLNLIVFGAASLASAVAPNMTALILLRFLMGLGLGAEVVVGYSMMAEFFPAGIRGRWSGMMCTLVTAGLPVSAFLAWSLVPTFGWRVMFLLGAIGSVVAWFLRRKLPESPRWLVVMGRDAEADALVSRFEREAGLDSTSNLPLAPEAIVPHAASDLFRRPFLASLIVGCVSLMAANSLIQGFVVWLPTFLVSQGDSIARSTGFALLMAFGGPVGSALGALAADYLGRKPAIVSASCLAVVLSFVFALSAASPVMPIIGFFLTIPIYLLVAVLFAIYVPELFPTALRLRGVGICNAAGRSASIIVPLLIGPLFTELGIAGVLAAMSGALLAMCVVVVALGTETRAQRLSMATA